MRSVLIVYYSHTGNNEALANRIQKRLGCGVFKISEKKKRKTISILFDFLFTRNPKISESNTGLSRYGKIIFAAPVWGGKVASPLRVLIAKEKDNIKAYSFISLCNGETGQKERLENELSLITGRKPESVAELPIRDLMPEDKRDQIKNTFNFRVSDKDLEYFEKEIEAFINSIA